MLAKEFLVKCQIYLAKLFNKLFPMFIPNTILGHQPMNAEFKN
jgi:hypothetical protein